MTDNIDLAAIGKLRNELLAKFSELSTKISKVLALVLKQRALSLNTTKESPSYTQICVKFPDESGLSRIDVRSLKKEDHICYVANFHSNWYSDWPKDWPALCYSMPVRWLTMSESDLIAEVSAVFKKHEAGKALKEKKEKAKEKKAKSAVEKTVKGKKIAAAKTALSKLSEKEREDLFDAIDKEAERSRSARGLTKVTDWRGRA